MDFELVLKSIVTRLNEENVNYAIIGGYAFGLLGISRNTFDLDLLVDKKDRETLKRILSFYYYEIKYETENIAQFVSILKDFGEIDVIYSFRKPSQEMLKRAKKIKILNNQIETSVLCPEDLIGLKLQAIKNDPERYERDIQDIKDLVFHYKTELDYNILKKYFDMLELTHLYDELIKE